MHVLADFLLIIYSKKSPKKPIGKIVSRAVDRKEAMNEIYKTRHYTMFEIAAYFNVYYRTVSRVIHSFYKKQ